MHSDEHHACDEQNASFVLHMCACYALSSFENDDVIDRRGFGPSNSLNSMHVHCGDALFYICGVHF